MKIFNVIAEIFNNIASLSCLKLALRYIPENQINFFSALEKICPKLEVFGLFQIPITQFANGKILI